jgi:hypothetical protein
LLPHSWIGPSTIKSFRSTLLAGDEEKAILLFQNVSNGHSLEADLSVSLPFPMKSYDDQTPLHLASLKAMDTLILIFLDRGGNPNSLNSNNETSVHMVCRENNNDSKRRAILEVFLQWRGIIDEDGNEEFVSVNKVDNDGNTACHYAASSGLVECVIFLAANGAILSIVNKDQMTCGEMADANSHTSLADILEIALVFPPLEHDMIMDEQEDRLLFREENFPPLFVLDSQSYNPTSLTHWKNIAVQSGKDALGLPLSRVEVLLDHFNWDLERTIEEYLIRPEDILNTVHLSSTVYTPFTVLPLSFTRSVVDLCVPLATAPSPIHANPETDIMALDDIQIGTLDTGDGLLEIALDSDSNISPLGSLVQRYEASPNSNTALPPDATPNKDEDQVCPICCEALLPPISPLELLEEKNNGSPTYARRQLRCGSLHRFCVSCWCSHWTVQISDHAAPCLTCIGYKCGDILCADDWSAAVLGENLTAKLHENRLRRIVDSSNRFRWCPAKDCPCIIHVNANNMTGDEAIIVNRSQEAAPAMSAATEGGGGGQPVTTFSLPRTAVCGNGHSFCVVCNGEGHAPCSCEDWSRWTEHVQREMQEAEGVKEGWSSYPILILIVCWGQERGEKRRAIYLSIYLFF